MQHRQVMWKLTRTEWGKETHSQFYFIMPHSVNVSCCYVFWCIKFPCSFSYLDLLVTLNNRATDWIIPDLSFEGVIEWKTILILAFLKWKRLCVSTKLSLNFTLLCPHPWLKCPWAKYLTPHCFRGTTAAGYPLLWVTSGLPMRYGTIKSCQKYIVKTGIFFENVGCPSVSGVASSYSGS